MFREYSESGNQPRRRVGENVWSKTSGGALRDKKDEKNRSPARAVNHVDCRKIFGSQRMVPLHLLRMVWGRVEKSSLVGGFSMTSYLPLMCS